ncbi:hypothetical protein GGR30_001101 [Martelella radicis]|uniref:Aa3 type cytochrome c oxidase subunit IV n=1 Tax=Martelella radicis TaxID=1397476 RepID=A0A7W6KJS6_9HYPH|nr:hypothetical protein [Martelella radicis]
MDTHLEKLEFSTAGMKLQANGKFAIIAGVALVLILALGTIG